MAGNRGLVEYSDLLKRPLEHFKYLLGASESQQVSLEQFTLYLDAMLLASSNEKHLAAFKETPDFASFKAVSYTHLALSCWSIGRSRR